MECYKMCQQSFLSKTVKIISIVSLSAVALGSVLNNSSSAMELNNDYRSSLKRPCPTADQEDIIEFNYVDGTKLKGILQPLSLPAEMSNKIFLFLPVKFLEKMALVAKHWYVLSKDDELWKAQVGMTRNEYIQEYGQSKHLAPLIETIIEERHIDANGQLRLGEKKYPIADGQEQFLCPLLRKILFTGLKMDVEKIHEDSVADMMEHIGTYCIEVAWKTAPYQNFFFNNDGRRETLNQFMLNNKISLIIKTENPTEELNDISNSIVDKIKNNEIEYHWTESMESEEEVDEEYFDNLGRRLWGEPHGESEESEEAVDDFDI